MNYCYIDSGTVKSIIPENDPAFPDIPITGRYSSGFVSHLIKDRTGTAKQGYIYDPETGVFSEPPASFEDSAEDSDYET